MVFLSDILAAQNCDCASQFDYVVSYFEDNNPAYQKLKMDKQELKTYQKNLAFLRTKTKKERDIDYCIVYMEAYVGLLKDHHSGISFNLKRKDLSTDDLIQKFKLSEAYRKFQKLNIDTAEMISVLSNKPADDVEGIYTDGRTLVFGIIKQENSINTYHGIVLKSNKFLDPGHVLIELTRKKNNSYDIVYNIGLLGFDMQRIFKNMIIENGQIPFFGFSKTINARTDTNPYEFTSLSEETNYLRLSNFNRNYTQELDSFYLSINDAIKSKPYLVIDIRNNGGGSEASYYKLLPYAYTKPLKVDAADVWVSPENIKRYQEGAWQNETKLVERMKAARPFSFIPLSEEGVSNWSLDSGTVYPKKIALLFNKGTASAGEGMIMYYMQSDKVITVGENSGGFIGYGNVMTVQTPCKTYTILCTTTKYEEKSKYEFRGLEPQYKPSKQEDWIQYAENLLKQ